MKNRRLFQILLTLVVLGAGLSASQESFAQNLTTGAADISTGDVTLADLDRIVSKARNLDDFLKNKELQREYFLALQVYHGGPEAFPESSFQEILDQLQRVVKKVPAIKSRLWETTNLGTSFEVKSELRTSGRALEAGPWNEYLDQWRQSLLSGQGAFREMSPEQLRERLLEIHVQFASAQEKLHTQIAGLPKRKAQDVTAEFYKEQKKNPVYGKMAAAILSRLLVRSDIVEMFESFDADVILNLMEELKSEPLRFFELPRGMNELPGALLSELRSLVPAKSALLTRADIFPIVMRTVRDGKQVPVGSGKAMPYQFDPIPRRLHGIWKGISIGECVGGGSGDQLTPERWATVGLKDTHLYHVRQGSSYLGFIQMVPIVYQNQIYGSVDFGAGALGRKIFVRDPVSGRFDSLILFELWHAEARKHLPKKWKGLVVGHSDAISNAGALEHVRSSLRYRWGKDVGSSKRFAHLDVNAKKIVKAMPEVKSSNYGGRMIFDGMVPEAGVLRRLINVDPLLTKNSRKLVAALTHGRSEYQGDVLHLLSYEPYIGDPLVLQALENLIRNSSAEWRGLALSIFVRNQNTDESVVLKKIELAQLPGVPEQVAGELFEIMTQTNDFGRSIVTEMALSVLMDERASWEKPTAAAGKYLQKVSLSADQIVVLERAVLRQISQDQRQSSTEILQVLRARGAISATVVDQVIEALARQSTEMVAVLAEAHLTPAQVARFLEVAVTVEQPSYDFVRLVFSYARSADVHSQVFRKWLLKLNLHVREQLVQEYLNKELSEEKKQSFLKEVLPKLLAPQEGNKFHWNEDYSPFKKLLALVGDPADRKAVLLEADVVVGNDRAKDMFFELLMAENLLQAADAFNFLKANPRLWHQAESLRSILLKIPRPSIELIDMVFERFLWSASQQETTKILLEVLAKTQPEEEVRIRQWTWRILTRFESLDMQVMGESHAARKLVAVLAQRQRQIPTAAQDLILVSLEKKGAVLEPLEALFGKFDWSDPTRRRRMQSLVRRGQVKISSSELGALFKAPAFAVPKECSLIWL